MLKYQLIRSKRTTLSLQIDKDGKLIARAPLRMSVRQIEDFISKKSAWINKKQSQKPPAKLSFLTGAKFYYLGNKYPLKIDERFNKVFFDGEIFLAKSPDKAAFNTWYQQKFTEIAAGRVEFYAQKYHLNYQKISIRQQKTRWGSCSIKNNLSLNYLLIMTPMSVIDYVIIHELAHTKIKNHSRDFWQLISKIAPEHKKAEHYLKQHSAKLHRFRV